jgi:hypothetical protein
MEKHIESKTEKESKDSNISKETKDIQKCYICLDIPQEPIYPAGCIHGLCKKHLNVINNIKYIIF